VSKLSISATFRHPASFWTYSWEINPAFAQHFDQRRPKATAYGQAYRLAVLSRHLAGLWIYSWVE
jgi:hypothetical protein